MSVQAVPISAPSEAGYFTSQADIEDRYGRYNVDANSNANNDDAGASATVFRKVLDETDQDFYRELRRYGYTLPAAKTDSADFAVLARLATAWARVKLYYTRGWRDVGGGGKKDDVAGRFAKLRDDTLCELRRMLANGIDFPRSGPIGTQLKRSDLPYELEDHRDRCRDVLL